MTRSTKNVKFFGNWGGTLKGLRAVEQKMPQAVSEDFYDAAEEIKRFAQRMIVFQHAALSKHPLKQSTIDRKRRGRKGFPGISSAELIFIETGGYADAIEILVAPKSNTRIRAGKKVTGHMAVWWVGPMNTKVKNGRTDMTYYQLAEILEEGAPRANVPPRKMWEAVRTEFSKRSVFQKLFRKKFKRRLQNAFKHGKV